MRLKGQQYQHVLTLLPLYTRAMPQKHSLDFLVLCLLIVICLLYLYVLTGFVGAYKVLITIYVLGFGFCQIRPYIQVLGFGCRSLQILK